MARQRSFLIWVGLLAILLALLNLPLPVSRQFKAGLRGFLAPLHELVSGTGLRVREAAATLRGLGGLAQQNRDLETEIVRLRGEARMLQAAAAENAQLRDLLGFRARARQRLIPGEIIARDASGWWQMARINRGSLDGVAPDLAVVSADGLAGRVVEVSKRTADVLLVSDPTCRVAARVVRTGSFGIVTGQGVGWNGRVVCRLEFVNRNHAIRPGDEVVTSGLGGVFPPDLLIGYIDRVEVDESGLYRTADVLPRAELGTMRHLFVLADGPAKPAEAPAASREGAP